MLGPEGLLVEGLKFNPEWSPFLFAHLFPLCHIHHPPAFLHQPLLVWASLPDHLVSIHTEHKFRLSLDQVVLGNGGSNIRVDLDDLYLLKITGEFADVFVCNFAIGVPLGCEVYDEEGEAVAGKVVSKDVEFGELLDGSEACQQQGLSQHFDFIIVLFNLS